MHLRDDSHVRQVFCAGVGDVHEFLVIGRIPYFPLRGYQLQNERHVNAPAFQIRCDFLNLPDSGVRQNDDFYKEIFVF